MLAAVGIHGVIAYSVSQRTREFGIRLALGEEPGHTRRSVLGGMRLVGVSMALGLTAALVLARLLRGQLYQVAPGDPLTSPGSRRCWRWWRSLPAASPRGGRPGWTRRSRSAANDHYSR